MTFPDNTAFLSELSELDWDFVGHTTTNDFARLHWHPARYPPQVPAILIASLSKPGEQVLDPFCGSGTTLVEAYRLGRHSLGIDTNPVATMMATAKVSVFNNFDLGCIGQQVQSRAASVLGTIAGDVSKISSEIPNFDEQTRWYHPTTLAELGSLWIAIQDQPHDVRVALLTCFSSILRDSSSQQKHWGWICDNVTPKEFVYVDAMEEYSSKIKLMVSNATQLEQQTSSPEARVLTGPCAAELAEVPDGQFDLIVTSPPYFGVTDYAKAQRLTFLWLDLPIEPARMAESGARSKRRRRVALEEFLAEMHSSFREIARVLKVGAYGAFVLGESPTREPHLDEMEMLMAGCGLKLEARILRKLPAQRGMIATLQHERIVICRHE